MMTMICFQCKILKIDFYEKYKRKRKMCLVDNSEEKKIRGSVIIHSDRCRLTSECRQEKIGFSEYLKQHMVGSTSCLVCILS